MPTLSAFAELAGATSASLGPSDSPRTACAGGRSRPGSAACAVRCTRGGPRRARSPIVDSATARTAVASCVSVVAARCSAAVIAVGATIVRSAGRDVVQLSGRQREVLERRVAGAGFKVIAHELGITVSSAHTHFARALERLDASTLTGAAAAIGLSTSREGRIYVSEIVKETSGAAAADDCPVRALAVAEGQEGQEVAAGAALLALRLDRGVRPIDIAGLMCVSKQRVHEIEGAHRLGAETIERYRDAVERAVRERRAVAAQFIRSGEAT